MNAERIDKDTVLNKLRNVEPTKTSVPETSDFLIKFEKDAEIIVNAWKQVFDEDPKKRLGLLFVCNDIMQKVRKTAPQFAESWKPILPECAKQIHNGGDASLSRQIKRMIKIWRGRKVFDDEYTRKMWACVGVKEKAFSSRKRALEMTGSAGVSIQKLNHPVVKALAALEKDEPTDSDLAAQVASLFPKLLSSAYTHEEEKRRKAVKLLQLYSTRLTKQIEQRSQLLSVLQMCKIDQETHIRRAQDDRKTCEDFLLKLSPLRGKADDSKSVGQPDTRIPK